MREHWTLRFASWNLPSKLVNPKLKIPGFLSAFCVVLGLLFACAGSATAALPPSAYLKMQAEAPEHLQIEILRVKQSTTPEGELEVRVTAYVTEVKRTKAKITNGDMVQIVYTIPANKPRIAGPAPIPVPKEGASTPAYLISIAGSPDFAPAAGAMSFSDF